MTAIQLLPLRAVASGNETAAAHVHWAKVQEQPRQERHCKSTPCGHRAIIGALPVPTGSRLQPTVR
jgi:hypothetical protein